MAKSKSNRIFLTAICAFLALAACGKEEKADHGVAAISEASEILRYVPADSPYVIAGIKPLPDEVVDKLQPNVARLLDAYRTLMEGALGSTTGEGDAVAPGESYQAEQARITEALSSLLSVEGLSEAGFSRKSRSVLYGHGLSPVLRFEVTEGKLFESALQRMEESLGEQLDQRQISGKTVRVVGTDRLRLYVLVDGKQVVVTLAPVAFDDSQVGALLGFEPPPANIVDADRLQDIARQYSFDSHVLGFVDVRRMFEIVAGDRQRLDQDVLAAFGLGGWGKELSGVCRKEMLTLVDVMPRMVMGSTEVSADRMQSRAVVELREDIAKSLAAVASPVPGLGKDGGGLMSFGMGLNFEALRDFMRDRVEAVVAEPYECDKLSELQARVAELGGTLQMPVPPVYYDVRGLVANIESIDTPAVTDQQQFAAVEGQFLLAVRDAPAVVLLGEALLPELASLNLEPDGTPVRLDLVYTKLINKDIFVALNEKAIAISIGEGGESKLADMLSAPAPVEGTLFSFTIDNERYYASLRAALEQSGLGANARSDDAMTTTAAEILTLHGKMIPRASIDVRIEGRGIVIENTATLGE